MAFSCNIQSHKTVFWKEHVKPTLGIIIHTNILSQTIYTLIIQGYSHHVDIHIFTKIVHIHRKCKILHITHFYIFFVFSFSLSHKHSWKNHRLYTDKFWNDSSYTNIILIYTIDAWSMVKCHNEATMKTDGNGLLHSWIALL